MAKDRSGGFHPPKGKPSGGNRPEGLGISTTPPEELDQYLERSDNYLIDDEQLDPSVPVTHPNRHTGKTSASARPNLRETDTTVELATDATVTTQPEELPGIIGKETFRELADFHSDCCVTIYLPTHEAGVAVNEKQDAILFKNALKEVSASLAEQGIDEGRIRQLLTPGYELLQKDKFWGYMGKGLAVFIAEGYFRYVKMPLAPDYAAICRKRFYMTPLVPVLACKEYFYLLVISKQRCQLYRADAFGMEPVHVEGLPEGVMAVKRLSDKDASTFRVGTGSGTGGANFHGMAGGNPDDKDNIAVYFEAVDDILFREVFNKENAPLLLAGVEYLIPIYRAASDYHNVSMEALTGSHEHDELHELYKKARALMEPIFRQPKENALTMYGNQSATPLTSSVTEDVVQGAFYGRISHLFATRGAQLWGTFAEDSAELDLHGEPRSDSEDLLDLAVIRTLANGGEAFLMDPGEMPAQSEMAAIFRY